MLPSKKITHNNRDAHTDSVVTNEVDRWARIDTKRTNSADNSHKNRDDYH